MDLAFFKDISVRLKKKKWTLTGHIASKNDDRRTTEVRMATLKW